MFQVDSTQPTEIVDNAIKFGAIGYNIFVMSVTCVVTLMVYALRSIKTQVDTIDWVKSNIWRFAIGFVVISGISTMIVVSPEVAGLFGAIGFQAEQSPIALGIFVSTLLIGATSEPTA